MVVPTGPCPVSEEKPPRRLGASPDSSKKEEILGQPRIGPKAVSIPDLMHPLHPERRRGFLGDTKYVVLFSVAHSAMLPSIEDEIYQKSRGHSALVSFES